jgi:hypothetical protein
MKILFYLIIFLFASYYLIDGLKDGYKSNENDLFNLKGSGLIGMAGLAIGSLMKLIYLILFK